MAKGALLLLASISLVFFGTLVSTQSIKDVITLLTSEPQSLGRSKRHLFGHWHEDHPSIFDQIFNIYPKKEKHHYHYDDFYTLAHIFPKFNSFMHDTDCKILFCSIIRKLLDFDFLDGEEPPPRLTPNSNCNCRCDCKKPLADNIKDEDHNQLKTNDVPKTFKAFDVFEPNIASVDQFNEGPPRQEYKTKFEKLQIPQREAFDIKHMSVANEVEESEPQDMKKIEKHFKQVPPPKVVIKNPTTIQKFIIPFEEQLGGKDSIVIKEFDSFQEPQDVKEKLTTTKEIISPQAVTIKNKAKSKKMKLPPHSNAYIKDMKITQEFGDFRPQIVKENLENDEAVKIPQNQIFIKSVKNVKESEVPLNEKDMTVVQKFEDFQSEEEKEKLGKIKGATIPQKLMVMRNSTKLKEFEVPFQNQMNIQNMTIVQGYGSPFTQNMQMKNMTLVQGFDGPATQKLKMKNMTLVQGFDGPSTQKLKMKNMTSVQGFDDLFTQKLQMKNMTLVQGFDGPATQKLKMKNMTLVQGFDGPATQKLKMKNMTLVQGFDDPFSQKLQMKNMTLVQGFDGPFTQKLKMKNMTLVQGFDGPATQKLKMKNMTLVQDFDGPSTQKMKIKKINLVQGLDSSSTQKMKIKKINLVQGLDGPASQKLKIKNMTLVHGFNSPSTQKLKIKNITLVQSPSSHKIKIKTTNLIQGVGGSFQQKIDMKNMSPQEMKAWLTKIKASKIPGQQIFIQNLTTAQGYEIPFQQQIGMKNMSMVQLDDSQLQDMSKLFVNVTENNRPGQEFIIKNITKVFEVPFQQKIHVRNMSMVHQLDGSQLQDMSKFFVNVTENKMPGQEFIIKNITKVFEVPFEGNMNFENMSMIHHLNDSQLQNMKKFFANVTGNKIPGQEFIIKNFTKVFEVPYQHKISVRNMTTVHQLEGSPQQGMKEWLTKIQGNKIPGQEIIVKNFTSVQGYEGPLENEGIQKQAVRKSLTSLDKDKVSESKIYLPIVNEFYAPEQEIDVKSKEDVVPDSDGSELQNMKKSIGDVEDLQVALPNQVENGAVKKMRKNYAENAFNFETPKFVRDGAIEQMGNIYYPEPDAKYVNFDDAANFGYNYPLPSIDKNSQNYNLPSLAEQSSFFAYNYPEMGEMNEEVNGKHFDYVNDYYYEKQREATPSFLKRRFVEDSNPTDFNTEQSSPNSPSSLSGEEIVDSEKSEKNEESLVFDLPSPKSQSEYVKYLLVKQLLSKNKDKIMHNYDYNNHNLPEAIVHFLRMEMVKGMDELTRNAVDDYLPLIKNSKEVLLSKANNVNFQDLLPTPNSELEETFHTILTNRLNNLKPFLTNLSKEHNNYISTRDRLIKILQFLHQIEDKQDVKDAIEYYLKYKLDAPELPQFNYQSLLSYLPKPANDLARKHYSTIERFFKDFRLIQLIEFVDPSKFEDKQELFKLMATEVINSDLSNDIKEAFVYYFGKPKLTHLELLTHKEITRKYDLTGIILDTLQYEKLSIEDKHAFSTFFDFISQAGPLLNDFDNWYYVATQGEFMMELFNYLLQKPQVPENVKESITKLMPLIDMNGSGSKPV